MKDFFSRTATMLYSSVYGTVAYIRSSLRTGTLARIIGRKNECKGAGC